MPESLREKVWKNNHGLVEIYGMSDDPQEHGYQHQDAKRIGLHIQSKSQDGGPMRTAGLPLSPQLARQLADQLNAWAEQIEAQE